MRNFRDNYILKQVTGGKELVDNYYKTAPKIVAKIEKDPNKEKVYEHIYNHYLTKCIKFIENKEYEKALQTYTNLVMRLNEKYLKDGNT